MAIAPNRPPQPPKVAVTTNGSLPITDSNPPRAETWKRNHRQPVPITNKTSANAIAKNQLKYMTSIRRMGGADTLIPRQYRGNKVAQTHTVPRRRRRGGRLRVDRLGSDLEPFPAPCPTALSLCDADGLGGGPLPARRTRSPILAWRWATFDPTTVDAGRRGRRPQRAVASTYGSGSFAIRSPLWSSPTPRRTRRTGSSSTEARSRGPTKNGLRDTTTPAPVIRR